MDINNTYLGYSNKLSPMQKTRVENVLDNVKRYNGIIKTNKQFIYDELLNGCIPDINENYQTYNRRTGENTKPKTVYIIKSIDNSYWIIEKTLFDFANYILENDFLNKEKANNYIILEQKKIEVEKQAKAEQEQREKEEQERKEKEKIDFENWLYQESEKYNNTEKLEILKTIFINEIGQFNLRSIRLLVLIDNIDNITCKEYLKSWLSYYNTASLKTFFHITGIKLGNTDKEIQKRLDSITSKDFTGMIPYKIRAERIEKEQEIYYKCNREGIFEECQGERIQKHGLDLFLTKSINNYTLTEGRSGGLIGQGSTKIELFEKFDKFVNDREIETVNNMIQQFIDRFGISPKYKTLELAVN